MSSECAERRTSSRRRAKGILLGSASTGGSGIARPNDKVIRDQDGDGPPERRRSVDEEERRNRWAKLILPLTWATSPLHRSIRNAEQEDKFDAVQGQQ